MPLSEPAALKVFHQSLQRVVEDGRERADERRYVALRRGLHPGGDLDGICDDQQELCSGEHRHEHTDHADDAQTEAGGRHMRTRPVYNRVR